MSMNEGDLRFRVTQEGIEAFQLSLKSLQDSVASMQRGFSALTADQVKAGQSTQTVTGWFGKLREELERHKLAFERAREAGSSFGGALGSLSTILTGNIGLLGAAAVALGTWIGLQHHAAEVAREHFIELRGIQAASGLSAEAANQLSNVFKVLTGDSSMLTMSFFRLSMELQTGGRGLANLGIQIRDNRGVLKEEGALFEEIRDKISDMTSATARSQAAREIFGRQAVRMLPILSMTREEYAKTKTEMESLGHWTEALSRQTHEYEQASMKLSIAWEGLWLKIAPSALRSMTQMKDALAGILTSLSGILEQNAKLNAEHPWSWSLRHPLGRGSVPGSPPADDAARGRGLIEARLEQMSTPVTDEGQKRVNEILEKSRRRLIEESIKADEELQKILVKNATDSATAELSVQLTALRKLRDAKEAAFQDEARRSQAGGDLTAKGEEQRATFEQQHRLEMQTINNQIRQAEAQMDAASLEEEKKNLEHRLALNKEFTDQRISALTADGEHRKMLADREEENEEQKVRRVFAIEQETAEKTQIIKLAGIDAEIAGWQQLRTTYGTNAAAYAEFSLKIEQLSGQRQKVIEETNKQIDESFKPVLADAQKFADEMKKADDQMRQHRVDVWNLATNNDQIFKLNEQLRDLEDAERSGMIAGGQRLLLVREKIIDQLRQLDRDMGKSAQDFEDERVLADAQADLDILTARQDFAGRLYDLQLQIAQRQAAAIGNFGQVVMIEMERTFIAMGDQLRAAQQQGAETARAINDAMSSTLQILFKSITDKTINLSNALLGVVQSLQERMLKALSDRLASMVDDMIAKMIAKVAASGLMSLLGGFGGGGTAAGAPPAGVAWDTGMASGGVFPGSFLPMRAFAGGGIARRPTLGMIAEGGAPEAVIPLQSGAVPVRLMNGGAGGTTVQVFDYRQKGANVEVQEQKGPDQRFIRLLIRDEIVRNINHGELDRSMSTNYGISRRPLQR